MTHLALLPEPNERPATIWRQCQYGGAQSNLNIATMQAIRSTTKLQITGSSWDRHMSETAVRNCREALDELSVLIAQSEADS